MKNVVTKGGKSPRKAYHTGAGGRRGPLATPERRIDPRSDLEVRLDAKYGPVARGWQQVEDDDDA